MCAPRFLQGAEWATGLAKGNMSRVVLVQDMAAACKAENLLEHIGAASDLCFAEQPDLIWVILRSQSSLREVTGPLRFILQVCDSANKMLPNTKAIHANEWGRSKTHI